jgi:hypothetical protein
MNMASIDTNILKNFIQTSVQIIAYRTDPGAMWTAIPKRRDIETDLEHYAIIPEDFHELPVVWDERDRVHKMCYQGKRIYQWKFSNGWSWDHERGLYDAEWKEPVPEATVVEKYYRIRICGDDVQMLDMTTDIKELVQASKDLAAIAIAAKVALTKMEGEK